MIFIVIKKKLFGLQKLEMLLLQKFIRISNVY